MDVTVSRMMPGTVNATRQPAAYAQPDGIVSVKVPTPSAAAYVAALALSML